MNFKNNLWMSVLAAGLVVFSSCKKEPAEITPVPPVTTTTLNQQLIAHYKLDGNANDAVGTLNGTVSGAVGTTDRNGKEGGALSFDGIDDLVNLGDKPFFRFGKNDFSISLWFYYDGLAQKGTIFSKRNNGSTNYSQYGIVFADNGYVDNGATKKMLCFTRPDDNLNNSVTDRAIVTGELAAGWHHVAILHDYDKSTAIYVDGSLAGESSVSLKDKTVDVTGDPLLLGNNNAARFFKGKLDDFRIYTRLLTAAEITELFKLK